MKPCTAIEMIPTIEMISATEKKNIEDISELHLLNKYCLVLNPPKKNNLLQNKVP